MLALGPIADAAISDDVAAAVLRTVMRQLRYATRTFVTAASDTPATTLIDGRVSSDIRVLRQVQTRSDGTFGPAVATTAGEIVLANLDGELDSLYSEVVIDDRPVRVLAGTFSIDANGTQTVEAFANFGTIFAARANSWQFTRESVRLIIKDPIARLQRPLQRVAYDGSGGIDGTADMAGMTKPLAFGVCRNVTPAMIDPLDLIFQVHDGKVTAIDPVYDQGVALTLARDYADLDALKAATVVGDGAPEDPEFQPDIPLGGFATCRALGIFRLSGQNAGVVTADVRGAVLKRVTTTRLVTDQRPFASGRFFATGRGFSPGSAGDLGEQEFYESTSAGIIRVILEHYAELTQAEFDRPQFLQFRDEYPYKASLFLPAGGNMSIADALALLLDGSGFFLSSNSEGKFVIGRLEIPRFGGPILTEREIVRDSITLEPLPYERPFPRWRVDYARNWTPMSETDLARQLFEVGFEEKRSFFLRQSLSAEAVDSRVLALHPSAGFGQVDGTLVEKADAEDVAEWRLELYSPGRKLVSLTATGLLFKLHIGSFVSVYHPRYELSSGHAFVVVAMTDSSDRRTTELLLFG